MDTTPNGGLEEYARSLDLSPEEVVTILDDALADTSEDELPPPSRMTK